MEGRLPGSPLVQFQSMALEYMQPLSHIFLSIYIFLAFLNLSCCFLQTSQTISSGNLTDYASCVTAAEEAWKVLYCIFLLKKDHWKILTQTLQRCGRMWQHLTEERLSDRSDLELSFLGVSPQNRSEKSWDRSWNPLASLSAWRWGRLFQRVLERCKSMLTSATMLSACRGCLAARWAGACNVWEWNHKPGDS